ncbi:MAG: cation:proton antiporter [Bacteroidota bacterium]|jgi:glutathione-regulated potassium-efflux system ancillary protein KefC
MSEVYLIDALWLSIAFFSGLLAKKAGLPTLIGFLLTGIVLNVLGLRQGHISDVLQVLADLGIMLLLFTIGLKIKIQSLFKKAVWLTASLHMMIIVAVAGFFVFLLTYSGLKLFSSLSFKACLLIGFALSFSSTVFAAKVLEERGDLSSFHGKISIGILIIQDIFAVLFLALTSDATPSLWVFAIPVYLYLIHFVLYKILDQSGHGELLTIFGFFAAFVAGAFAFKFFGLKADLGALAMGMLMVQHPKADELYDRMMEYKDFFLIAFFVSIGLTGIPGWPVIIAALVMLVLLFFKSGLFMLLFSKLGLKARTSFLTALTLSHFSEFGLIIGVVAVNSGMLSQDWLMVMAILMSVSFLIASPYNANAHALFDKYQRLILKMNNRHGTEDNDIQSFGDAEYLIIGMGSIGRPAYDHLQNKFPGKVVGIDYKQEYTEALRNKGYNVLWGDATYRSFWSYKRLGQIKLVLLAMSDYTSNKNTLVEIVKMRRRKFKVAAITHYPEEVKQFKEWKVDFIYDYKSSIGADFAEKTMGSS